MLSRKKIKLLKLMCPIAVGLYFLWWFMSKRLALPEQWGAAPLGLFLAVMVVWFFLRKNWLRCPHCRGKLYDSLPGEQVTRFSCPRCGRQIEVK